uniref:EOG090X00TB n=1 Tax=Evadne anonyx TaxID=141404 RepID=A0A9N6WRE9_9CRUS|nr:EOG090X00TB [Evadne anonyx]
MDTPSDNVTISANAYNPFAAVSASGAIDGLDWLSSGGAMQAQGLVSPYDIPDASAIPLDHNEELFLEHDDHLDASLEPLDDLLDVELPLPPDDLSLDLPTNEHLDAPLMEAAAPAPDATVPSPSKVRPPPPPRPPTRPSPPHETQQLILSVTGAMQVTSDHLDRLRAAAPSPIPGHPSMVTFTFTVAIAITMPHSRPATPSRPPPPGVSGSPRPPRPTPPGALSTPKPEVAPPPSTGSGFASIFGSVTPEVDDVVSILNLPAAAPSRPPPPVTPEVPAEEIDLLGLPTKPRTRTKNDILKLFDKKEESKDLLAGDVFDSLVDLVPTSDNVSILAPVSEPAKIGLEAHGVFQAPIQSAADDMASLESSSFAPVETAVEAAEMLPQPSPSITYTEMKSPVQSSNPIAIPERADTGREPDFDAFSSRFESVGKEDSLMVEADPFDPFSAGGSAKGTSAWGTACGTPETNSFGFGASDGFDSFLAMTAPPPVPHGSPRFPSHQVSHDSDDEEKEFSLSIKPRSEGEMAASGSIPAPILAPPPRPAMYSTHEETYDDTSPPASIALNPFLQPDNIPVASDCYVPPPRKQVPRSDSQDTPTSPLFDEDQSVPLEIFPRVEYNGEIWEMQLRQPNKKKITSQRFWKKIFVKLGRANDVPVIQLYNNKDDIEPFQELQLQACYSVSDISAQQFDTFGKIFTVKVQYVFYKERPGIRPGQVSKTERLTSRLQQFAAYAIQGDYNGVKEFGSDLRKLGVPVEHAPHISELLKLGTTSYEELKHFSSVIEEALFLLKVPRDRSQGYKTDEVQMTAVDEFYVEQDKIGRVLRQIARVRVFVLAFLSGMPDVELGVNDLPRQGKEIVGRHDIIPVVTEEWIRLEDVEFHDCVDKDEFEKSRTVKFRPPDACYVELLRFRVRPPKNRELPLQVRTTFSVSGNKIELKSDVLVPGYISRKYGQIPCEDVAIRFPLPESWIYMFRVEKHFRYGSVKSSHRRAGKIKGIERFLGTVETAEPTLIEVTSGSAKYEHHHRAIVWRMPRLPKGGQGSYTTHNFVCRINLTSYDQMPESLARFCHVEFTMPATYVSHTTLRSLAVTTGDPPEKYVRYLARHEYVVEIEHTSGPGPAAYIAATESENKPVDQPMPPPVEEDESDSDSD